MSNGVLRRAALAAAFPLLLAGCQLFPVEEQLPAAPIIQSYETTEYLQTPVLRGELTLVKKVSCDYAPSKREHVGFSLGGEYVEGIYVTEGQTIHKGDLLAELVMNDLSGQITVQQQELEMLELQKSHLQSSYELESDRLFLQHADDDEVEKSEANYRSQLQTIEDAIYIQQLTLYELRTQLQDRQLLAPIDGTATFVRDIPEGQRSVEGQTIVTIADMDSAVFTVTGDNTQYFPLGTQVVIRMKDGTEYSAVSVSAEELELPEASKPTVYLQLSQPDPTLEDGDRGTIELILDSREDVLYVNRSAVRMADDQPFVYILNEEGLRIRQDVTTGLETADFIEITSGLSEGDSVIIE